MLTSHWTFSPLAVVAIVALCFHEVGCARLRARTAEHRPRRVARAWLFRTGIAAVILASASPLAWWGMQRLTVHMICHVILMCFAPVALVGGGPVVPMCFALPVGPRRAVVRAIAQGSAFAPLRRFWGWCTTPIVGFLALNVTMVVWHVPALFNWAMLNLWVHSWVMEPSFLIAGILFWRSIAPSHPFAPRARLRTQLIMVLATNFEMLVLALSMSIFTNHAWYSSMTSMAGMAGMQMAPLVGNPFGNQQAAAAILWICGDFWALPAVIVIIQRLIARDGSPFAFIERRFEPAGEVETAVR